MYSLVFLCAISFSLSFILTPIIRNLFLRLEIVDRPDDNRRVHRHPIPRAGGVSIALSYGLAFVGLVVLNLNASRLIVDARPQVMHLLPAAGLIFTVGLTDDIIGLRPWRKLIGQIAAASLAFAGGIHLQTFAGHEFAGWWPFVLTIAWLVICTNAVNLIDGIDGLAAGVGLFATVTSVIAALLQNNVALALATVPLAGALLGFLRYNFSPATIFLGDSGSLLIGFLLGCYSILWSEKAVTMLGVAAPILTLSLPLLDTALAVARRFLRGQPIFEADRRHIHHRLLDRGLTTRETALTLYGCCAVGALCSLLMMNRNASGLAVIMFCSVACLGIRYLDYAEFGIACRMFIEGSFRRQIKCELSMQALEQKLAAAANQEACWVAICATSSDLGFNAIEMSLNGSLFQHQNGPKTFNCWNARIPVYGEDYIKITYDFRNSLSRVPLPLFAKIVSKALDDKFHSHTGVEFSVSSACRR